MLLLGGELMDERRRKAVHGGDDVFPMAAGGEPVSYRLVPRGRSWLAKTITALLLIVFAAAGFVALLGVLYHGPTTIEAVTAVMPGVPLFPLAQVSSRNRGTQRALAIPLQLMRLQGATHAEAVLLQVPAEHDFVIEWYRRTAPFAQWHLVDYGDMGHRTRLVFLRGREGLQMLVGDTVGGLLTPIQIIYLNGLTPQQIEQLKPPQPIALVPLPPLRGHGTPVPPVATPPPSERIGRPGSASTPPSNTTRVPTVTATPPTHTPPPTITPVGPTHTPPTLVTPRPRASRIPSPPQRVTTPRPTSTRITPPSAAPPPARVPSPPRVAPPLPAPSPTTPGKQIKTLPPVPASDEASPP